MAEGTVPLFSIGAVARMLDVSAATIRTWEARYGDVVPQRSEGGQRLYSRDQVEQLRFVKNEVARGRRPGEAHRLLAERVARGDSFGGAKPRVLLVDDVGQAERTFAERTPVVVVMDDDDSEFSGLVEQIRAAGVRVLPIDLLERPLSLV